MRESLITVYSVISPGSTKAIVFIIFKRLILSYFCKANWNRSFSLKWWELAAIKSQEHSVSANSAKRLPTTLIVLTIESSLQITHPKLYYSGFVACSTLWYTPLGWALKCYQFLDVLKIIHGILWEFFVLKMPQFFPLLWFQGCHDASYRKRPSRLIGALLFPAGS